MLTEFSGPPRGSDSIATAPIRGRCWQTTTRQSRSWPQRLPGGYDGRRSGGLDGGGAGDFEFGRDDYEGVK